MFSLIRGLGPEHVYLNTKIFFLGELETEKLKHVYSGGHLKKMTTIQIKILN